MCQDTYKEVKKFHFDNGTVRVHIPDLTQEERNRRLNRIHDAAADLLRAEENLKKRSANPTPTTKE